MISNESWVYKGYKLADVYTVLFFLYSIQEAWTYKSAQALTQDAEENEKYSGVL